MANPPPFTAFDCIDDENSTKKISKAINFIFKSANDGKNYFFLVYLFSLLQIVILPPFLRCVIRYLHDGILIFYILLFFSFFFAVTNNLNVRFFISRDLHMHEFVVYSNFKNLPTCISFNVWCENIGWRNEGKSACACT